MGAEIWTEEYQRRHNAARDKLDKGVASLYQRICPVDARVLDERGRCPVCGRNVKALRDAPAKVADESKMTDEQREKAERRRAFYARFNREQGERDAAAARAREKPDLGRTPTRAEIIAANPQKYLRY